MVLIQKEYDHDVAIPSITGLRSYAYTTGIYDTPDGVAIPSITGLRSYDKLLSCDILSICRNPFYYRSSFIRLSPGSYVIENLSQSLLLQVFVHTLLWDIISIENFVAIPSITGLRSYGNVK